MLSLNHDLQPKTHTPLKQRQELASESWKSLLLAVVSASFGELASTWAPLWGLGCIGYIFSSLLFQSFSGLPDSRLPKLLGQFLICSINYPSSIFVPTFTVVTTPSPFTWTLDVPGLYSSELLVEVTSAASEHTWARCALPFKSLDSFLPRSLWGGGWSPWLPTAALIFVCLTHTLHSPIHALHDWPTDSYTLY